MCKRRTDTIRVGSRVKATVSDMRTLFSLVYLFLICRRFRPANTREMSVKSVPKIFSACKARWAALQRILCCRTLAQSRHCQKAWVPNPSPLASRSVTRRHYRMSIVTPSYTAR